jgi:hypothetical protein
MGRGPTFTEAEKAAIWDQRYEGASLNAIARHVGRSCEGIRRYINLTGGVRPSRRRRSGRVDGERAGGDFSRFGHWRLLPCDCEPAR